MFKKQKELIAVGSFEYDNKSQRRINWRAILLIIAICLSFLFVLNIFSAKSQLSKAYSVYDIPTELLLQDSRWEGRNWLCGDVCDSNYYFWVHDYEASGTVDSYYSLLSNAFSAQGLEIESFVTKQNILLFANDRKRNKSLRVTFKPYLNELNTPKSEWDKTYTREQIYSRQIDGLSISIRELGDSKYLY